MSTAIDIDGEAYRELLRIATVSTARRWCRADVWWGAGSAYSTREVCTAAQELVGWLTAARHRNGTLPGSPAALREAVWGEVAAANLDVCGEFVRARVRRAIADIGAELPVLAMDIEAGWVDIGADALGLVEMWV